ncbi:NTP transferase domain-containing protein [Methanobacterium spitsbergense]|uniref:NTP transferase domain-containing protein n=1 Tax=Methanobacterium spitsbergense TaxID=2874285 RepID=A0A8T5UVU7_9EURY|nr:NTP transferase domain-containing protein [Methanobacterium spitsbergense]MBZ2164789.1 NTP transferase domain-containing protein [Methanobacterium spitsbergense]
MVTAIVMAGGKGTRMGVKKEKPLIEVGGIPMIQHVINALLASKRISDIIILTSPNTPKTFKFACIEGYSVFQTPGNGYIEDLQYYISKCFPQNPNKIILTITADLPLITSEIINHVLIEYAKSHKPAMCIAVPLELFVKNGLKPSIVLGDVVPSGLNILRSNNKQQDEEVLKLGKIELAVNINSCEDIVVLEDVLSNIGLKI